jgi:sec-independent protein translocase protein TatA
MGPLGWPEIIIILVVLLLLFGAKRLPEMGRSLGRGMREFKDAVTTSEPEPKEINTTPTPATQAATTPRRSRRSPSRRRRARTSSPRPWRGSRVV